MAEKAAKTEDITDHEFTDQISADHEAIIDELIINDEFDFNDQMIYPEAFEMVKLVTHAGKKMVYSLRSGRKRNYDEEEEDSVDNFVEAEATPPKRTRAAAKADNFPLTNCQDTEVIDINSPPTKPHPNASIIDINSPAGPSTSNSPISISDNEEIIISNADIKPQAEEVIDLTKRRKGKPTQIKSSGKLSNSVICLSDEDDSDPLGTLQPGNIQHRPPPPVIHLSDDEEDESISNRAQINRVNPQSLNISYRPVNKTHKPETKRKRVLKERPDTDVVINIDDSDIVITKRKPVKLVGVRTNEPKEPASSTQTEGMVEVKCPICLDTHADITKSKRQVLSTPCGHLFCDACLKQSLKQSKLCPKCRKRVDIKKCITLYLG